MSPSLSLDKSALLGRVPMFAQLGPRELATLAEFASTKRLKEGEILFRKGDPGSETYVISSGRVKITSADEEGSQMVLRIMDPGEVLGDLAFLLDKPRSATATAIEDAQLLVIQRRYLRPVLEQQPQTAMKLLETLAIRLVTISEQFEDRVFRNLPSRLARKLIALSENYGVETQGGVRIELLLTQSALGEMVGTSRESVSKCLNSWKQEGYVEAQSRGRHGSYYTIRDLEALETFAGYSLLLDQGR